MVLREWLLARRGALVFLSICFLLPTIIIIIVQYDHPVMEVGIVLVDDCPMRYAQDVKDGFDNHSEYFKAVIIEDFRLNSSGIRVRDGFLLTGDFFNESLKNRLSDKYGIDVVLYVCDKRIFNWDEPKGGAWWGQADLETGSAVMTVACFRNDTNYELRRRWSTGVHEIGHLVGFLHPPNPQTQDDLMLYADPYGSQKFNPYYEFTLPFHLTVYELGHGYRVGSDRGGSGQNMLVIKLLADLFFLPYVFGVGYLLLKAFNIVDRRRKIHRGAVAVIGIFGFTIYTTTVYCFEAMVMVVLYMAIMALFYHAGALVLRGVRKKKNDKKKLPRKHNK